MYPSPFLPLLLSVRFCSSFPLRARTRGYSPSLLYLLSLISSFSSVSWSLPPFLRSSLIVLFLLRLSYCSLPPVFGESFLPARAHFAAWFFLHVRFDVFCFDLPCRAVCWFAVDAFLLNKKVNKYGHAWGDGQKHARTPLSHTRLRPNSRRRAVIFILHSTPTLSFLQEWFRFKV